MAVKPQDLYLPPREIREKYTQKEIQDTIDIINRIGETKYIQSFTSTGVADPGKMDVMSREYLGTVAKNFIPSVGNTFSGLLDLFKPETYQALYEAGPEGILNALGDQYGTPADWARGDFSAFQRTVAEDPFGQLTTFAPGVGAVAKVGGASKLGAAASRAGRAIHKATPGFAQPAMGAAGAAIQATGRTAGPMLVDPVGTTGKLALRFSRGLVGKAGQANRLFLHFITGEPVQALESMQQAGRLSARQMKQAGANPIYALFGAKHAAESIAEDFGKTDYQLFKEAQKNVGGLKDETLIFGHVNDIMGRAEGKLTGELGIYADAALNRLMPEEYRDFDFKQVSTDHMSVRTNPWTLKDTPIHGRPLYGPGGNVLSSTAVENMLGASINDALQPLKIRIDPSSGLYAFTETGGKILSGADAEKIPQWLASTFRLDLHTFEGLKAALIGDPAKGIEGLMDLMRAYSAAGTASEIPEAIYKGFRHYIREIAKYGMQKGELDVADIRFIAEQFMPKFDTVTKKFIGDNPWTIQQKNKQIIDDIRDSYSLFKKGGPNTSILNNYMAALDDSRVSKQLLDEVEILTGESINAPIAGLIARKVTPSSLVARGSAVSAAQRMVAGGKGAGAAVGATLAGISINPAFFSFLLFSSPRFTGSQLARLGVAQRTTDYVKTLVRLMHQHPVGKLLSDAQSTIYSVGTVLDKIQKYNEVMDKEERNTR